MTITTNRLDLIAGTPALVEAELHEPRRFAELLQADIPANWPPPLNTSETMEWCLRHFKKHPGSPGWVNWYFVLRNDGTGHRIVIGNGGFRGKADATGSVEVGYSILEQFQKLGYASEAVRGLLVWAFAHPQIHSIVAETYPHLKASIRVLEKNGFALAGKGSEPEAIRYIRTRERQSGRR
jgi:RimJ/RimL family protein N-acetyltransferase